jgi:adenosylcobinamide-phosphate synthase
VTFVALVAALLLEQARALSSSNPFYRQYRRFLAVVERSLDAGSYRQGLIAWTVAAVPPVAVTAALALWLDRSTGLLAWLFDVGVLYLCLGFRQFGYRYRETHDALRAADSERARIGLEQWYGHDLGAMSDARTAGLAIERGLLSAHRHVFAVIAWFAVFGAGGALLYRIADFLRDRWGADSTLEASAFGSFSRNAFAVCDWVPARLTAISFAIVGDFEDALYCWRTQSNPWPEGSEGVVVAAGAGAVGVRLGTSIGTDPRLPLRAEAGTGDEPDAELMSSAVGLVWRALVLWLFVILLVTVAGWLGTART